jgi:transcriptional regulator with XRE-family HTH domain
MLFAQEDFMTTTLLDPKLLGLWARCVREAQYLSQEALAEAAGITVRTVQRFEAGETVQIGSRRSLAKALGYGDQDIFDDPKFDATVLGFFDDLRAIQQKQVDDQHPDQTRLPAQFVSSGEEAIRFAQGNDAALFDISPDLNRETKEIAATFADYVRDVGELDDLSAASSLTFANELDDMLKALKAEGAIVYTAKHDRKFVGENWADKPPMSMTLGYLVVVPATKKLEHLYVSRKTKLF